MEIRPGPAALMAAMLLAAAVLPPLALFLVATGAVIAVHEAAHALAAHRAGAGIEAAGLGFGPLVARPSLRGVALELRAIPAGIIIDLLRIVAGHPYAPHF
jgi:membrane-associated protease RseP (regulator of RpoE activity)